MQEIESNLSSCAGRKSGIQALGFDKNGDYVIVIIGRLIQEQAEGLMMLYDIKQFFIDYRVKFRIVFIVNEKNSDQNMKSMGKLREDYFKPA